MEKRCLGGQDNEKREVASDNHERSGVGCNGDGKGEPGNIEASNDVKRFFSSFSSQLIYSPYFVILATFSLSVL